MIHRWGDGFKYFNEVESAAQEIGDFCVKYGRINVRSTKEKWGTARVYLSFGFWGFHSLIHPRRLFSKWPSWLWKLDCNIGTKLLKPLDVIIVRFHCWIYKLAYKQAIKKYPFIKDEILAGADYKGILKDLYKDEKKLYREKFIKNLTNL